MKKLKIILLLFGIIIGKEFITSVYFKDVGKENLLQVSFGYDCQHKNKYPAGSISAGEDGHYSKYYCYQCKTYVQGTEMIKHNITNGKCACGYTENSICSGGHKLVTKYEAMGASGSNEHYVYKGCSNCSYIQGEKSTEGHNFVEISYCEYSGNGADANSKHYYRSCSKCTQTFSQNHLYEKVYLTDSEKATLNLKGIYYWEICDCGKKKSETPTVYASAQGSTGESYGDLTPELQSLLYELCRAYGLDYNTVLGFIFNESGGDSSTSGGGLMGCTYYGRDANETQKEWYIDSMNNTMTKYGLDELQLQNGCSVYDPVANLIMGTTNWRYWMDYYGESDFTGNVGESYTGGYSGESLEAYVEYGNISGLLIQAGYEDMLCGVGNYINYKTGNGYYNATYIETFLSKVREVCPEYLN